MAIEDKPSRKTGSGGKPEDTQVKQMLQEVFGSTACPSGVKVIKELIWFIALSSLIYE